MEDIYVVLRRYRNELRESGGAISIFDFARQLFPQDAADRELLALAAEKRRQLLQAKSPSPREESDGESVEDDDEDDESEEGDAGEEDEADRLAAENANAFRLAKQLAAGEQAAAEAEAAAAEEQAAAEAEEGLAAALAAEQAATAAAMQEDSADPAECLGTLDLSLDSDSKADSAIRSMSPAPAAEDRTTPPVPMEHSLSTAVPETPPSQMPVPCDAEAAAEPEANAQEPESTCPESPSMLDD